MDTQLKELLSFFNNWMQRLTPIVTLFITVLLDSVCVMNAGLQPYFSLCVIYYWGGLNLLWLPVFWLFLWGLLGDVLAGDLLGADSLRFLSLYAFMLLRSWRFKSDSFAATWVAFVVYLLVIFMPLDWILSSLLKGAPVPITGIFLQVLLTIPCYPIFVFILKFFTPSEQIRAA